MNAGSLFTGIGGLDLGVGVPPAWFCEYDKHCRTVLERHWPGVPIYPDVRELGADAPRVDVLHGGYPCQPFSAAGKRQGADDPRHLWPEFARLIRVLRPRVVVAENVAGHLRLGFHAVLADLAGLGMDVRWGVVRASDVGAPHQRARLFVVAQHSDCGRWDPFRTERASDEGLRSDDRRSAGATIADTERSRRSGRAPEQGWGTIGGAATQGPGEGASDAACSERRGTELGSVGPATERAAEPRERSGPRGAVTNPECVGRHEEHERHVGLSDADWGAYAPAIRRWAHVVGDAPRPTDERGRLMPEFVEWMMGFPIGWTDGLRRTHRLRMLGNAVVPQQAAHALSLLAAAV